MSDITAANQRFRSYLPVIVDVETAGFNARTDALLEIAAVVIAPNEEQQWDLAETVACHIEPFAGANLEPEALKFTGIDPYHPFRMAVSEKEGLQKIFKRVRKAVKQYGCTRAILVGHNAHFDLDFLNAAVQRTGIKRNPFHPFSCFDTATAAGIAYGQTVLAKAVQAAGLSWNNNDAHSAIYDAEQTARLFCGIINSWDEHIGIPQPVATEDND